MTNAISIEGRLAQGGRAHAGEHLRVELWPVHDGAAPIARTFSDASGRFGLDVAASEVLDAASEVGEVELRVVEGTRVVHRSRVRVDAGDPESWVEVQLDADTSASHEVHGLVHGSQRLEGVRVRAVLRSLHGAGVQDLVLGDAGIDAQGWFRLPYSPPRDTAAARVALLVQLVDGSGAVLLESEAQRAPAARLRMDLRVPAAMGQRSEYELVLARLHLELGEGGEAVDALGPEALEELATWLDVEPYRLAALQRSRALQQQTSLPAEVFYALGRSGLPLTLAELAEIPAAELHGALDEAVADDVVSARALGDREALLEALGEHVLDAAIAPGPGAVRSGLAEVLAGADLPESAIRDVLSRYRRRTGGAVEFWESLHEGGDGELAEDVRPALELAVELSAVVGTDRALSRSLHELRRNGRWHTTEDLVDLDFDTWCELLEQGDDAQAIEDVEARDEAVEDRAEAIMDALEAAFPSRTIRRTLTETEELGADARRLLERAPDHDLLASSIRDRLAGEAALAEGLEGEALEAAIEDIEAVERVARVTPRANHVALLVGTGMRSAHAIAATPRRHFVEIYGESMGGRSEAAGVHAQAQQQAAAATLAMVRLVQALQQSPLVLGGGVQALQTARDEVRRDLPNASALFGSVGACGCEHCSSVYSPAAYFVDLMRYLDVSDPKRLDEVRRKLEERRGWDAARLANLSRYRPLDALLVRRPDLADIPLTCENTFTPLPYIDLVNEILEARVVGGNAAHDTGKTPADVLRAVPQHVDRRAYDQLQAAVYPTTLPFHEPLAVMRAYLGHLGVTRPELLRTFHLGRVDSDAAAPVLLAEDLGMSLEELAMVARAPEQPWRHFGFDAAETDGKSWIAALAKVTTLANATGLDFAQLTSLFELRFVNGDDAMTLESPTPDCDLEKITVVGLDEARLVRMLRCVRLQRRLGWSFAVLDRALAAFGATDLDAPTLRKLVDARTVAKRLDRTIPEVLSLWAPMDTSGDDSLFVQRLRTRSVAWRTDDANAFVLRPDRLELATTGDSLDPVAAALLAAFRITSDDLTAIRGLLERRGAAPKLDVAGISAVHRVALLGRALRLRTEPLGDLLRLLPPGADPFAPRDPAATLAFLDVVDEVAATDFTPERLGYLLAPIADARRDPGPSTAQADAVLGRIRRSLGDAFHETAPPTEITLDAVRSKLALVLDTPLVQPALDVLDPRSRTSVEQRRAFFDRHLARLFPDAPGAAARLFEAPTVPAATESTPPTPAPAAAPIDARFRANLELLLLHLMPVLRAAQLRVAIVQALADALGISTVATARLVEHTLRSRRVAGAPMIQDFHALLGTGLTAAYHATPDLSGAPVVTRVDPRIDFAWNGAPPAPGVLPTNFSVRWTGRFLPRAAGPHVFSVTTDGAVRLSIAVAGDTPQVVLDHAGGSVGERLSTPIVLDPARLYAITLEYRNRGGAASLVLQHAVGAGPKAPVPTTSLYSSDGLASFAPVVDAYRRLHKAAMIVAGFGITDAQLEWLVGPPALLDLDALPLLPADVVPATATAAFGRWRQLASLFAVRRRLARSDTDLFAVFRAADPGAALDTAIAATGWDRAVVTALLRGAGVDAAAFGIPTDPLAPVFLPRLARAVDAQRRLGVAPDLVLRWATAVPDADLAASVVQAAKARYDEKRWLEVAQSLNDPLRIARRDALVAFLMPRMGIRNRDHLFEWFLIDVDMNPCMGTSRIKQAISAVQTFFQRCLMNLEPQVPPRLIDEDDWKWLKNYRVWEANRKVFLYPENWIEPELRDDKSPIFKELERTILQQEIKKENVESAFIDYLQKLDEVARLDVRAVWYERRTASRRVASRTGLSPRAPAPADAPAGIWDGTTYRSHWDDGTYHVFARSFDAPHVWYYRRLDRGRVWSSWEKIDADIEGDHLVPVVFQRRLYLFWTVFREVNKPALEPDRDAPPYKLGKDWEISVAYSVYDRGKWTRKRLSSEAVTDRLAFMFPVVHAQAMAAMVAKKEKRPPAPRIEGSAWLPKSAYSLRASASDDRDELVVHLYRRLVDQVRVNALPVIPKSGEEFLQGTDVTPVAAFRIDGCNGELDAKSIAGSAFVAMRRVGQSVQSSVRARVGGKRRRPVISNPGTLVPIGPQPFDLGRGGHIDAPAGFRVDGTGFVSSRRGTSALALAAAPGRGPTPLLGTVHGEAVRLVPVNDGAAPTPAGLFPFFFQDRRRSYFVRPVAAWNGAIPKPAPLVARPIVGVRALAHLGRPLAARPTATKGAASRRARPARRRGESDESIEDHDTTVRTDADDQRDDADEQAWHPDDVSERRAPQRARKTASPSRRPPTPRPVAPPAPGPRPAAPAPVVVAPPPPPQTTAGYEWRLRFTPFEHPNTCRLIRRLMIGGIEQLLALESTRPHAGRDHVSRDGKWQPNAISQFARRYRPGPLADAQHPRLDVDFTADNPYGAYNWELFFHAPLQVAIRLAKDGRHEEAQRWFHFIFDPTSDSSAPIPARYWNFAPFRENDEYAGARELMALLSYGGGNQTLIQRQLEVHAQVTAWWETPFAPHVIARLRTAAYQKAVVMKYIDNLIEWGDKLFRRDTMETIQEATQLYVLAGSILGPRPQSIPPMVRTEPVTFRTMRGKLDVFGNWVVRFENSQVRRPFRVNAAPDVAGAASVLGMATQYFCIPTNPQLDKYWDTVADRLFKIRNCMNIKGTVRSLALFEPPIDPAVLVRAAAAGADLGSVVADLNAPPPHHRFRVLLARAVTLTEEVRRFGKATLEALERKDAESLTLLQTTQTSALLEAMRDIGKTRIKQVEEEVVWLALEREHIDLQIQHVAQLAASLMNPQENARQQSLTASQVISTVSEGVDLVSKVLYAIPEFQAGAAGGFSSPFTTIQLGGQMFGDISAAFASSLTKVMGKFQTEAEMAEAQAEYQRRQEELMHQHELLLKEKEKLTRQIGEINLKLEIHNAELRRHDLAVDQSRRVEAFLRDKFTGEQLYGWMLGQLSGVYFQAYKTAFDCAKLAERALRFERGDTSVSFVEFSYWDSLKKGLHAGDRLLVDLRRMETAALEGNERNLEVTRHVSLRDDAPAVLLELLSTGRAKLDVTETLLDGDFPGHYARRIKCTSLSVVAPTRPHTNINCTLTLLASRIRTSAGAGGSYPAAEDGDDPRFLVNFAPIQAIATSRPHADTGLFELRFDDDRYLPFEGAGAVSSWRLELRQADNHLDLSQVTDVVLTLSYSAKSGGAGLEAVARAHREKLLGRGGLEPSPAVMTSVRRDLPDAWKRLLAAPAGTDVEIEVPMDASRLSGRHRGMSVRIERVLAHVMLRDKPPEPPLRVRVDPPTGSGSALAAWLPAWPGARTLRATADVTGAPGLWKLSITSPGPSVIAGVDDVVLLFDLRARVS